MKAVLGMTADTVGKDLLSALVTELRLLPEPWAKTPKSKQNDIIDRLRDRVAANVKMAVHLISASGRTTVTGELEQITIKGGAKAVINVSRAAESLHDFYDAQGTDVLIVVSGQASHTAGMDEIQGEEDQRALDLGHEYHDNDGGGMDRYHDDGTIEGEVLGLPAPDKDAPSQKELDDAHIAGVEAGKSGKPKTDCPNVRAELVKAWMRGWMFGNEQHKGEDKS
ncbi:Rmf/CrpP family protein [Candidatus Accumulibacter sp. ACC005]|uniref:ribosome modulation factor n=1 Tax=Candidatus Accumulibacter sp. ACC005 TaxID=2823331 RepID=UPI0025C037BF|nr:Rmf/CrpP family protein [Candidatus Accumulibacter sp. ACC005]